MTMTDVFKALEQMKLRLRAIELRLGINISAADLAPKPSPYDPTARMSMPRNAVEAMTSATAGVDVDIIADGRRRNPAQGC